MSATWKNCCRLIFTFISRFFNLKMMHRSKLWKTLIEALNFIVENQNNPYTGDTNYDNQEKAKHEVFLQRRILSLATILQWKHRKLLNCDKEKFWNNLYKGSIFTRGVSFKCQVYKNDCHKIYFLECNINPLSANVALI